MSEAITSWRAICLAVMVLSAGSTLAKAEDDASYHQTAAGVSGYIGIVPAEIVRGHPPQHTEHTMHGGPPAKAHEYHLVVALFDADTGARITDAGVLATIFGPGNTMIDGKSHPAPWGSHPLPDLPRKSLEPMEIAGTITYGGYFQFPETTAYTIQVVVQRPGKKQPVILNFEYDNQYWR